MSVKEFIEKHKGKYFLSYSLNEPMCLFKTYDEYLLYDTKYDYWYFDLIEKGNCLFFKKEFNYYGETFSDYCRIEIIENYGFDKNNYSIYNYITRYKNNSEKSISTPHQKEKIIKKLEKFLNKNIITEIRNKIISEEYYFRNNIYTFLDYCKQK